MGRFAATAFITASLAGMGAAGVWTVREAAADYFARRETVEAAEKAIAWMPEDAEYHFRLAVLAGDEQPGRAMDELRRSVALDPWNAQHQIELGLRYEAEGNGAAAERCFLRAAEADRQYLPRWTLANYYFRQGDRAKFWASARAAAQMAYGDAAPLFRLCDAAGETGDLIERLGVRKPEIRASYLAYLLAQGRIDAAGAAARRVLESGREADVPLVLAACDRMLAERRADEAMDVWNRLAAARRIPFGRLSAGMVTNGQFLAAPISRGFDWRLPNMDGVSASGEGGNGGLRLSFSGKQRERCEPLWQMAPVKENSEYALRCAYRTESIAAATGLRWQVYDANGGAALATSDSLSADGGSEAVLTFRTPAGCRLVRVALGYERAQGTTRIEGDVVVRAARLEEVRPEVR